MEENPKPRRRWFRFSLRTMLVVVTVLCVGSWLWGRSIVFQRRAKDHEAKIDAPSLVGRLGTDANSDPSYESPPGVLTFLHKNQLMIYHMDMSKKYRRAARYPWLPVEPDPPEPQRQQPAP